VLTAGGRCGSFQSSRTWKAKGKKLACREKADPHSPDLEKQYCRWGTINDLGGNVRSDGRSKGRRRREKGSR
jgi:hypothetical protein